MGLYYDIQNHGFGWKSSEGFVNIEERALMLSRSEKNGSAKEIVFSVCKEYKNLSWELFHLNKLELLWIE